MFDNPSIVCHNNFSLCKLPVEGFTKNVSFVRPHFSTEWGRFSVIDAMLSALRLLYKRDDSPDWFVLLSGADYPIKPAQQIITDLQNSEYDAHIECERIDFDEYKTNWERLCYDRYCTIKFKFPFINKQLRPYKRVITLRNTLITKRFIPFSERFFCYAGEFWFTANRKTAKFILEYHKTRFALASHYRNLEKYGMVSPDESYLQTIIGNSKELKRSNNIWRYIDWSEGKDHPKSITLEDLQKLRESSAHFARKFDINFDTGVIDELSKIIF
jgi:hypothetical protein